MGNILRKIFFILLMLSVLGLEAQNRQKNKLTLDYIDKYKDIAMTEMVLNKIPASITLAQGILESGNGQSELATKGNNHFGIKCHSDWKGKKMYKDDDAPNECFRVYNDAAESYRDHSAFLKRDRYKDLYELKITDYKGWAKGLKKAGYATLPTYAAVLVNIIETYELYEYDKMVTSGKFKVKKNGSVKKTPEKKEDKPAPKAESEKKKKQKPKVSHDIVPSVAPDFMKCKVVAVTPGKHYVRINFGVKFIITKDGDCLSALAKELRTTERQLVKYNNLGSKKTFVEGEVLYVGPKRQRAADGNKVHVVKKGETLTKISQYYAVRLDRLFKMNGLDENSVLQVGDVIVLR
ncbi:MAG: glucosaminidase domain-containing protein [Bacteroidales bacterium]|nr:glucosaminidase domain-containing protein [Bacteroidales bacterium]